MSNIHLQLFDFLSVILGTFLTVFCVIMFRSRMAKLIKVDDYQKMALPVGSGFVLGLMITLAYLVIMGFAVYKGEITRLEFLITSISLFVLTYVPFKLDKAAFIKNKNHAKPYAITLFDDKKRNFLMLGFLGLIIISSSFILGMRSSLCLLLILPVACFYLTKFTGLINLSFFIIIFSLSFLQYDIYFRLFALFSAFATLAALMSEKEYLRTSFASCFNLPFVAILLMNNVGFYNNHYMLLFAPLVLIAIGVFVSQFLIKMFKNKNNTQKSDAPIFWGTDMLNAGVKQSKIITCYAIVYVAVVFATFASIYVGRLYPFVFPLVIWMALDFYGSYLKSPSKKASLK